MIVFLIEVIVITVEERWANCEITMFFHVDICPAMVFNRHRHNAATHKKHYLLHCIVLMRRIMRLKLGIPNFALLAANEQ